MSRHMTPSLATALDLATALAQLCDQSQPGEMVGEEGGGAWLPRQMAPCPALPPVLRASPRPHYERQGMYSCSYLHCPTQLLLRSGWRQGGKIEQDRGKMLLLLCVGGWVGPL